MLAFGFRFSNALPIRVGTRNRCQAYVAVGHWAHNDPVTGSGLYQLDDGGGVAVNRQRIQIPDEPFFRNLGDHRIRLQIPAFWGLQNRVIRLEVWSAGGRRLHEQETMVRLDGGARSDLDCSTSLTRIPLWQDARVSGNGSLQVQTPNGEFADIWRRCIHGGRPMQVDSSWTTAYGAEFETGW